MSTVQEDRATLHRVVEELPGEMVATALRLVERLRDGDQIDELPHDVIGDPEALLRDLQEGLADIEAGNVVDHAEVIREMRERFGGRVSPVLQARLDAL